MARKYSRDNRGRFASGGGGATARGGRLRTAAGNKRKTQTMQSAAKTGGTISKGKSAGSAPKAAAPKAAATKSGRSISRVRRDMATGKSSAPITAKAGPQRGTVTPKAAAARAAGPKAKSSIQRQTGRRELLGNSRTGKGNAPIIATAKTQRGTVRKPTALNPSTSKAKAAAGAIKAKPARAAAKPMARKTRKSVGSINSAKAGRIVSRIDANRPGLRKASASSKRTTNMLKTHERATNFILSASAKARKKGENISVNESVQRGVATASSSARRRAAAKRR